MKILRPFISDCDCEGCMRERKKLKQEIAKSFQKWLNEHAGYFCNDCFGELRKQRWLNDKNKTEI